MTQTNPTHPSLVQEFSRILSNAAPPYHEPASVVMRRRVVVVAVLLAGASLLGFMHTKAPGDPTFYWLALGLAAVWAVGAWLAGPLHLGVVRFRGRNERPVFTGTGMGLLLGAIFVLAGLAAQRIPPLNDQLIHILGYLTQAPWREVVLLALFNAVAEEMFFRGALFSAFGRHYPMVFSTLLYVAAILAAGNLMLGFTALVLGTVCAIERRATGGVLAPVFTHLVWGLIMVLALPPLFGM